MTCQFRKYFSLLLLLVSFVQLNASHIRAGDITAKRISQTSYTYVFTFDIYFDTGSRAIVGELGIIDFGDGRVLDGGANGGPNWFRSIADSFRSGRVNTEVGRTTMVFTHTFQSPGIYSISYEEQFRNVGTLNIDGASFFVETTLKLDPAFFNNTPVLTIDPVDKGCVGSKFLHNPGAYDVDGDSLAYKIVIPKEDRDVDVNNYLSLDDEKISTLKEDGTTPAFFQIDSLTGTITWDSPMLAGQYNIAFIVQEWRYSELSEKWVLLGYVTRDMQILVEDCDNQHPVLEVPEDICVEAGELIEVTIHGIDPDGDDIQTEAFGGPFELNTHPATFIPIIGFRPQPAISTFTWQTNISHVRERPYEVVFKISDNPKDTDIRLVDFQTWKIKVVAPAPQGLSSSIQSSRSIQLAWDEYIGKDFGPVIQVWRKANGFDFNPDDCIVGIPANSGYKLIDEVPVRQLSYVDTQNVRPGVQYCYRLVAKFPQPKGGKSYASLEACTTIPLDVPAITNVSVISTDQTDGEMEIKWVEPLEIDQTLFSPPYRYELIQYTGLNGEFNRTILTSTPDTSYVDKSLNTLEQAYHYRVRFFDSSDRLIDSSAVASSVRLQSFGLVQSIDLDWNADVPWSNRVQEFPYHYIYRNRTDSQADNENDFVLIDSIDATNQSFSYLDRGKFNNTPLLGDREYCYRITTQGSYGNPLINVPLINFSQEICVQPNDSIAPPRPMISIQSGTSPSCELYRSAPCGFNDYSNTINWASDNPDEDIAHYNIYFSQTDSSSSFQLIGTSNGLEFTHSGLSSLKGCYQISAVDRSGNESVLSDPVCLDNCPHYELPNAFTPNGDGINDTFTAFDQPTSRCARFVKSVQVKVFSRWGGSAVFTFDSNKKTEKSALINWDGIDDNGKPLPAGTYYYHALVTFDVFDIEKRTQEFKNWVKIIR